MASVHSLLPGMIMLIVRRERIKGAISVLSACSLVTVRHPDLSKILSLSKKMYTKHNVMCE